VLRDVSFEVAGRQLHRDRRAVGERKTRCSVSSPASTCPRAVRVLLDGTDLSTLDEERRARLRGERVGFVFQSFQLIPTLTALENVAVPLELRGERGAERRAAELLDRVGLGGAGTTFRRSSRAASSSAWPWPAPSSTARACSSPTSPPEPRHGVRARIVELLEGSTAMTAPPWCS
jgi:hypothetical protein